MKTVTLSDNNYNRLVQIAKAMGASPESVLNLDILDTMILPTGFQCVDFDTPATERDPADAAVYAALSKLDNDGWQPDTEFEEVA